MVDKKRLINRLNDGQVDADQTEEEPSSVNQDQVYYIII